jgi:hypothetical protein
MKPLKKYQRLLAVALLSLVTHKALAQSVSSVKPGRNIVTNPGFEENAASWVLDNWMKNEVAADRDNKYPHSGTWSMKVQLTKVVNTPVVMFAFPKLAIRPGSAIQVRFWARGISNGANLSVMIRKEVDPRPTYLRTEMYLTDDWLQYIYTVQLPSDADPATTSLRFALNQTGVFWIDDVEVVELPPMDNSTAPLINPVRNPSFEAGTDGWTATFRKREFGTPSQESGNGAPAPDNAILETRTESNAPQGQRFLSLKIDPGARAELTSAYFPARYGRKAKLSFYLRADSTRTFSIGAGGGTNSGTSVQMEPRTASSNWQQFTLPLTLKPAQDGVYFVDIRFNQPGAYDIDAVSLVEEESSNMALYPPAIAIQPADNAPIANLYTQQDTPAFKLVVAGEKPGFTNAYQVNVVDYREQVIAKYTVNVTGNANGYGEAPIQAPAKAFGAFRIEARAVNSNNILAEQLYSVLPTLPPSVERPESFFGGHADFTPYNLEIARKAGFRWLRTWPPLATTWIAVEPQPGVWNFQTADIANAVKQGFQVIGMLGTAPDFKADINTKSPIANRWSRAYPPKNISEWKEYVARCVTAFGPYIKTWEVWNEPDGGYLQVKPEQKKNEVYATLLQAAREVLDSLKSPATLIGPAVANINAPLGWELLEQGTGLYMDAFSFHFYSLAAGGNNPDNALVTALLERFRMYNNRKGIPMPLWHTEGGMYLQGGRSWLSTYRIPASSPTKKPEAAAAMVRAALLFKAMDVKRYFDFELYTAASGTRVNTDMTSGFIEVTGIPGPGIAAHAAMVALTEDATPAGFEEQEQKGAKVKVAHFKTEKGTIDVYWSDKPVAIKKLTSIKASDKLFDMMGNPVSPEDARTGEFPLYIIR